MLSVFITPCTKPISIHRASNDACAAVTASNNPTYGFWAAAADGWCRSIAWSASRRTQIDVPGTGGVLEAAHPQVTARDPGQHRTVQPGLALHRPAGRDDGQRPGGRERPARASPH